MSSPDRARRASFSASSPRESSTRILDHPKGPRASELTSQYAEKGTAQRRADVERHELNASREAERRAGELAERARQAERDKQIRFRSSGNVIPSWSWTESQDAKDRETRVLEQMNALDDRELDKRFLRPAFRRLDRDKSGAIDLGELRKVTKAMKCELSEEQLAAMMKAADTDGNGQIEVCVRVDGARHPRTALSAVGTPAYNLYYKSSTIPRRLILRLPTRSLFGHRVRCLCARAV